MNHWLTRGIPSMCETGEDGGYVCIKISDIHLRDDGVWVYQLTSFPLSRMTFSSKYGIKLLRKLGYEQYYRENIFTRNKILTDIGEIDE